MALLASAWAQSAVAQTAADMAYNRSLLTARGGTMDVTVSIEKNTKDVVYALGITEALPEGWVFEGIVQDTKPGILISPASGATGVLEFAWLEVPSFPVSFTYQVSTQGKAGTILGQSLYRFSGAEQKTAAKMTSVSASGSLLNTLSQSAAISLAPLSAATSTRTVTDCAYHSADTTEEYLISLSELLRVIQFYNSNGLHCQAGTEDGYAPGPGDQSCDPHDSDYNPSGADWTIDLTELTRVIQFYNSDGYRYDHEQTSEDGFLPGNGVIPSNADTLSNTQIDLTCGVLPYLQSEGGVDFFTLYIVNDRATTCSDERTINVNREGMEPGTPAYNYDIDLYSNYSYKTSIPEENAPISTIGNWTTFCNAYIFNQYETIHLQNPQNSGEESDFKAKILCPDFPNIGVEANKFDTK